MGSHAKGTIHFGPFEVTTQVFLTTPHSFAVVNLKPLLPGHVLVCPKTPHKRLTDLTPPELTDLFSAVQRVQRMLAQHYFTPSLPDSKQATPPSTDSGSFNIAIQDGIEAGQTVPHLHVHVIPRIRGSTSKNPETDGDALYESMAAEPGNVGGALWDRELKSRPEAGGAFPRIEDQDRMARSMGEMEAEADVFKKVLASMDDGAGVVNGDGPNSAS
ncbi:HIT-like domain-containing protein [Xylariaceae sp. FL1019]|nr:HIT-like domain-containing protein [Xylariaceae sp. FL1019]